MLAALLGGFFLFVLFLRSGARSTLRRIPGEPISLLGAESIARWLLRANLMMSALGMLGVILSLAMDAMPLGAMVGVLPVIGLVDLWSCRKALRLLEQPGAFAERRYIWLVVQGPNGMAQLQANPRLFRVSNKVPSAAAAQR